MLEDRLESFQKAWINDDMGGNFLNFITSHEIAITDNFARIDPIYV